MTRIEKIIVVVLCLVSLSFLGYMIAPWTSQGTPAAAAPGAPAAAPTTPPPPSVLAPETNRAVTMRRSIEPERVKLGTPIQYANWGMSPAELEASGGSHIVKASISQTFPNDRPLNGRRGSVLDVNADEVFSSS